MAAKKLLKHFAETIARYERIIQKNENPYEVNAAKDKITQLTQASQFSIEDMIEIDEMVLELLQEKN